MDALIGIMLTKEMEAALMTGFRFIHLLGLVLGVGAATLLDLLIIKLVINRKVTEDQSRIITFYSRIVSFGLILLWLSGLGFLAIYGLCEPAKLGNPKIWAKILIVGVLTLNGVFIHKSILPLVRSRVGKGLFDGVSMTRRSVLLAAGAVSATSWYVPMLLGTASQLNNAIPASMILLAYTAILLIAILAAQGIGHAVLPSASHVTLSRDEYEALLRRLNELNAARSELLAMPPRSVGRL